MLLLAFDRFSMNIDIGIGIVVLTLGTGIDVGVGVDGGIGISLFRYCYFDGDSLVPVVVLAWLGVMAYNGPQIWTVCALLKTILVGWLVG